MLLTGEQFFSKRRPDKINARAGVIGQFHEEFDQGLYLSVLACSHHSILDFVDEYQTHMVRHAEDLNLRCRCTG